MIPRVVSFGIPLGSMLKNQVAELVSIEKGDKLTKQACISYHDPVLLVVGIPFDLAKDYGLPLGGHFQ